MCSSAFLSSSRLALEQKSSFQGGHCLVSIRNGLADNVIIVVFVVVVMVIVIAGFFRFFDYDYDNDMIHQSRFWIDTTQELPIREARCLVLPSPGARVFAFSGNRY
jgi:hypothetical protein